VVDKTVVEQHYRHELGYLLELKKLKTTKFRKMPNIIVISKKEYQTIEIGKQYLQRI